MSPTNKFYDINQDAQELIKRLNVENNTNVNFNNSNDILKIIIIYLRIMQQQNILRHLLLLVQKCTNI